MKTTKSPRRVLEYAHLIGKLVLPDYSHPNSPKIFTQPQLFACLVLKEFLRLDYRKLEALLIDAGDLAAVIGLDRVPTFSCFQKAAKRLLLNCHAQRYLDKSIRIAQAQRRLPRRVSLAALDGTGLESQHVSHYYVKRRAAAAKHWQKTTYQRFPKAGILCDTKTHLVLAVVPERGPGSDVKHFRRALTEAQSRVKIDTLAADAGYDGEHHHRFARERCGVRSLIPPRIGRPTTKPPSGYWRRQMKQRLHLTRYSQRWQVETVNSMLKRLLGSALRARKYWSQCREILLRAITLNIMILRRLGVFYRAGHSTFPHPRVNPRKLTETLRKDLAYLPHAGLAWLSKWQGLAATTTIHVLVGRSRTLGHESQKIPKPLIINSLHCSRRPGARLAYLLRHTVHRALVWQPRGAAPGA